MGADNQWCGLNSDISPHLQNSLVEIPVPSVMVLGWYWEVFMWSPHEWDSGLEKRDPHGTQPLPPQ